MCCLLSIFLPFPWNALSNILEYIYAIFDACAAAGWPKNVIDIILTVNLTGHLTIPFHRLTFECLKPLNANEKRFGPTNLLILWIIFDLFALFMLIPLGIWICPTKTKKRIIFYYDVINKIWNIHSVNYCLMGTIKRLCTKSQVTILIP